MARRKGAFYFSLDVDFFKDLKIRVLLGKYGADGITLYLYLLCEIYAAGYYLKVDDDFKYIVAQDLNMSSDKTGQILNFLCKRSLLDDKLFTSDKVLTSHRIQSTFQEINKGRGLKIPLEVDAKYWLLSEAETQPFIKVIHFNDISEKNNENSKKKDENSENFDTKKRKENKSKLNSYYCNSQFKSIVETYESNIGVVTPVVFEILKGFVEEPGAELTIYAIEEAARANARNIRYIEGIVRNWQEKGITSIESAKLASAEHKSNANASKVVKGTTATTQQKKNFFQDYDDEISDFELQMIKQRLGDAK